MSYFLVTEKYLAVLIILTSSCLHKFFKTVEVALNE